MERVIKGLFIAGCIITGGAVSLVSGMSHAEEAVGDAATSTGVTAQTTYQLTVNKGITLTGVTGPTIEADPETIKDGNISATVMSNAPYTLSLSAADTNLTNKAEGADPTQLIPMATTLTAGTNGWGIKTKNSDNTTDGDYLMLSTTPQVFYTSTAAASSASQESTITNFTTSVAINKLLAPGDYSTIVTVTAAITE